MLLLHEYPFLKIEVDENTATLVMTWNGVFSSAMYREATQTCVAAVKQYNLKNWLADARRIDEIQNEDQDWTNENILIPISELGVQKVAIVIPDDVHTHLAISAIMVKGRGRFRFDSRYFVNKAEACSWFSNS